MYSKFANKTILNKKKPYKIYIHHNKTMNILCEYADPISREQRLVEICYNSVLGHSNNIVYLGSLKDSKNNLLCEVAIKQICIKKDEINKEVEIMKKVHHENIVNLYHSYRPDAKGDFVMLSLIMEYCEGIDLTKFFENYPNKPEWKIRDYFRQIVNGLNYLHSEEIIHRDIKPQNILVTNHNKTVKIADYGISRFIKLGMTSVSMFKGTYGFMAPEVIDTQITNRGNYDYSADIFSLGVTLYYIYFQKQPWSRKNNLEASNNISCGDLCNLYEKVLKKGFDIFPNEVDISYAAKRLMLRMLAIDPKERIKIGDILQDPYLKEEMPMIKNPKITGICQKIDFEANKIVLAQDLLKKIHKYEKYCENKLVLINSLVFLSKYIQFSTLSLDSALKQDGLKPWFPKEKWALFYQEEIYLKIVKKVKMMVCGSRTNLETLLAKINMTEIIIDKESILEAGNQTLTNLLKEYKKIFYKNDNDKLVTMIYELMIVLNFTNPNIRNDYTNFKFENFLNNLNESLQNKRWVILKSFEAFFTKMKI